jgi:GNAT superfamily N-acetyltransferase
MGNQAIDSWTIRPARPDDWRAARMLLPQAVHFGSGSAVWVAESSADRRLVAAAALCPRLRSDPVQGARLALHVVPPWRRRGIARALVAQTGQIARRFDATALFAWDCVQENSPALELWQKLGFDQRAQTQIGVADVHRALEYLGLLYQQLLEHDWIPAGAKIVSARQADHAQIAALHARYLGGTARHILWRMTGQMPDPCDLQLSPALILDGKVKAFTLVRMVGKDCHVDATVVDPSLRGGWANLMLKYEGIRWVRDAGAMALIFQTHDRHTDTRKLNRQMGGITRHLIEPYRMIKS